VFSLQNLKRTVSQAADGQDVDFSLLLANEVARVNAHYSGMWCEPAAAPARLTPPVPRPPPPHARPLRAPRSNKLNSVMTELEVAIREQEALPGGGSPSRARADAQRLLVSSVVPELGRLRLFVVLNYTAVVKARRQPPEDAVSQFAGPKRVSATWHP